MKKVSLIFGMLVVMANAFAAGNMAESSVELAAIEVEAANFNCEDCLLSFDKESKVVITDNLGHVIFYNENVQNLDISSWSHGSYVVKVNDKETFEFSI